METNTLLLILWEIYGVTWSIGNPYQWHAFTYNQFYGNYMVIHTWLSHILPIPMGIIW